jgi:hypothetical protein
MNQIERLLEIVTTYRKHGWSLQRVLMTAETRAAGAELKQSSFADTTVEAAAIDAVWFSRPSHEQREAWELRLVADTPYALFETFESDEPEEQREELRREMEARMREHMAKDSSAN